MKEVKVPVMVNKAHVMFKLEKYADCIKDCTEVIEKEDYDNVKVNAIVCHA